MPTVTYIPIEDGQEANNQLFNSRFLALHNAINGGLDSSNLSDLAVTTPKLADASVTTVKLANDAVTSAKFKPGFIDFSKPLSTPNLSTTSTAFVDVAGGSITYTAGPTPEKLILFFTAMIIAETGAAHATLSINGVDHPNNLYVEPNSRWQVQTRTYVTDLTANQSIIIKMRFRVNSGSGQFNTDGLNWQSTIRGFAIGNS